MPQPSIATLFPYTTLFRSCRGNRCHARSHRSARRGNQSSTDAARQSGGGATRRGRRDPRSEEHTSELQSQFHLVCRLLLEKKNNRNATSLNISCKIFDTIK